MNAQFFYEMGRLRTGWANIPLNDVLNVGFYFSTKNKDAFILKGDGTAQYDFSTVKNRDYTDGGSTPFSSTNISYSSAFTGDLKAGFKGGLKDVYSIFLGWSHNGVTGAKINRWNIQDIETFFGQFPNLYSIMIDIYAYQNYTFATLKGDFAKIPDSVERVIIMNNETDNAAVNTTLNLSNFSISSKLKHFDFTAGNNQPGSTMKLNGDLAKLPVGVDFFKFLKVASGSSITYTAGKVWASSFDTLSIPLPLSHTELDNLLIDMDNSITTKIGAGIIYLLGYRTSTSDAAVASLQSKGFTVNIQKYSITPQKILDLDFQNNFTDTSSSALTMVAGGTSNQPTFALSGRKAGEYCAVFNGSQSIKTTTNLPVNSDKVTIAFWIKTIQTSPNNTMLVELSANSDAGNAFYVSINHGTSPNKLTLSDHISDWNYGRSIDSVNTGNWIHVVATIDRALDQTTQNKIYINGVLGYVAQGTPNNNGNFVNNILYIGQRGGSSLGFNGSLTLLKIYNYPFTPTEVTNLYNSEV